VDRANATCRTAPTVADLSGSHHSGAPCHRGKPGQSRGEGHACRLGGCGTRSRRSIASPPISEPPPPRRWARSCASPRPAAARPRPLSRGSSGSSGGRIGPTPQRFARSRSTGAPPRSCARASRAPCARLAPMTRSLACAPFTRWGARSSAKPAWMSARSWTAPTSCGPSSPMLRHPRSACWMTRSPG